MFNDYSYLEDYWALFFVVVLIIVGVLVLFYFSQYNLLNAIAPQNRLMTPSHVFLQLIPIFGAIYCFIVTAKIADSIRLEADNRELGSDLDLLGKPPLIFTEYRPTYNIGIARCILGLCSFIPLIGTLVSIAGLVCWIIYWSKIVSIRHMISSL